MPTNKLNKAVTCTVGAPQGAGIMELIGPAVMIYVTGDTKVEPGTELQIGRKVLVDYRLDLQNFGANLGMLALRVRPYGPDPSDVRELQDLLDRLLRAGLEDPGFGDPSAFLAKLFNDRLTQGKTGPVDLSQELVRLLEKKDLRFPMDGWQHDIEPALGEMEEKLNAMGVTAPLSRSPVQAVFERYADEDDDQVARRHFCAAIAQEANEALSRAGVKTRWHVFADLPWEDDEPFWLLVTPEQREGLLREGLFKAAPG